MMYQAYVALCSSDRIMYEWPVDGQTNVRPLGIVEKIDESCQYVTQRHRDETSFVEL